MKIDKLLFITVAIIITISIIASSSLSSYVTRYLGVSELHFFIRQSIFAYAAVFIIWFISRLDPDIYFKRIGFMLFVLPLVLMLAMPFLPESIVHAIGGAKRWINLGFFSLAPVEFFKIGFIFFLAWSFDRKIDANNYDLKTEFKIIMPYIGVFGIVVLLIAIMQKDLGQVIVLAVTLASMALMAGASFRVFKYLSLGILVVGIIAIASAEHRINRLLTWWSMAQEYILSFVPESIASHLRVSNISEPYQISHSLNAIKHGSIFGEGFGNGVFKLGYLSEVHTDFVIAGLAEEVGFLGILGISLIFITMIFRILKIANRNSKKEYFLFCYGVAVIFSSSFLMNVYGITSITPIKGIAVPLLSYGGSSMMASAIAIGLVLMLSKKAQL